jgi:hypothetical protein
LQAGGVDLSSAANARTVFRDSNGRVIDNVGDFMRDKLKDQKEMTPAEKERQRLEWGKGAS